MPENRFFKLSKIMNNFSNDSNTQKIIFKSIKNMIENAFFEEVKIV